MIVNKKLIQKLIKESIRKLILEKAKFTKAENFLKDPKNQSIVFERIKSAYETSILLDFENDATIKEEANKNIENAFNAILNSSPKWGGPKKNKIYYLDKTINKYVTDLSNIPAFGSNPFYDSPILLEKIKEKNNFSDQEANEYLMNRIKSFSKSAYSYLSDIMIKSITHDFQRKSKSDFMKSNKDILSNLNFVHYPYAFREYSKTDTTGIGAVLEVLGKPLEFLQGTVVNSPDELAGIGYPKGEKLRDSIGMGSELGGKIEFPYIGFLISGTITYFDEKDAQSSTYRSSYIGGHRDASGFVRYPNDNRGGFDSDVMRAYKSNEELKDYIYNFDRRFGSQTKEERENSEWETGFKKHNYGEAFIDNWTAVGMIAQWDLIVEKFKERITSGITALELNPRKEYVSVISGRQYYNPIINNLKIRIYLEDAKFNLDIVNNYAKERELRLRNKRDEFSLGEKTEFEQAKSALDFEHSFNSIPGLAKQLNISKEEVPAFIEDYSKNIKPTLDQLVTGDILYHELNNDKVKQFINDHYNGSVEEDFENFYSSVNDKIKESGTSAKIKGITTGLERINNDLVKFESINLKSYDNNFNEYDIRIFTKKMRLAISESVSQLKSIVK